MSLKDIVDKSTKKLFDTLTSDYTLSEKEQQKIRAIIENAVIEAIEQTRIVYQKTTTFCCGPEADLAHKIEIESKKKIQMLIANLNALR